jgi:hypothetical protein
MVSYIKKKKTKTLTFIIYILIYVNNSKYVNTDYKFMCNKYLQIQIFRSRAYGIRVRVHIYSCFQSRLI